MTTAIKELDCEQVEQKHDTRGVEPQHVEIERAGIVIARSRSIPRSGSALRAGAGNVVPRASGNPPGSHWQVSGIR